MDIWLIQNGEKSGPIHDFEVRRKIENGELPATTPAWHEGLGTWRPLVEIELFRREFDKPAPATDKPDAPPESRQEKQGPPPLPDQPHLVRRFWARWLDLYLFAGLWWLAMWAVGRDVGLILQQPWIMLFRYVPWFVLEAFLLHRFGTTPGKWLLGIRVVNNDGSLLNLAESTRRSARVLFIGLGFGWNILSLICQFMSWFTTRRLGRPLWDHAGGHRLETTPLDPGRIISYILVLILSLSLQMFVLFPFIIEEAKNRDPEFKAKWEELQKELQRTSGQAPGESR